MSRRPASCMQCQARLVPGQQTTLQIVGANNRFKLHGRVVRCEVAGLSGDLQYHVAVAFDPDPCPLPVSVHMSTPAA